VNDKIVNLDEIVNHHAAHIFPPQLGERNGAHADEEMAFGV
jgi:hypothetical protein